MSKDVMQIENPGILPEGLQKILDTGIDSLKLLVEHLGTMQLAFFLAVMYPLAFFLRSWKPR